MIRARFKCNPEDPRPVTWPIKHPYWVTGTADQHCTVVAYADDLEQLMSLWPDATDVMAEETSAYVFTERFSKPDWFTPENPQAVEEDFPTGAAAASPAIAESFSTYTEAIGTAGETYFRSFGEFAPRTPATFRWQDLWDAMRAAAGPAGVTPTEDPSHTNGEPHGESQLGIRMLAAEEAVAVGPTFSDADIIKNLRTYISLWDPVDYYVRKHPTTKLGRLVPECALRLLQEGDEAAKTLAAMREELQAERGARVQAEEALELADRLNEELMEQTARLKEYERSHEKNVVRIRNLEEHIRSIAEHMGVPSSTVPYQTKNRIMFALTQMAEILDVKQLNPDNVKQFANRLSTTQDLAEQFRAKYEEAVREKRAAVDQYQRDVYGLNNEGDPIGGEPAGGYANELKACREELEKLRAQVASKRHSTDQYLEVDPSQVPVAYYIPEGNGYTARITLDEKIARHWSSRRAAKIVEMVPAVAVPKKKGHSQEDPPRINNGDFDASRALTACAAFLRMPPGRLETMDSSGQVPPGVTVKLCTRRRDLPVVYSRFSRVPMPGEHVEYELRVYQVDAVVMQPIAEDPDRVADVYLLGFEAAARASEKP